MPTQVEFIFYNPDLTRIGVREVISASYSRRLNKVGTCTLLLDAKTNDFKTFSQEDLGLIIQISDEFNPIGRPDLDAFWLLVDFDYLDSNQEIYEITFLDSMDILDRRRVAYLADESLGTSPQARISEPGNVAMKRIFDENFGALAQDRNLEPYVTSGPVSMPSPIIQKTIQFKNVLSALGEIARASREKGTALFFDVVARETIEGIELEFKTFVGARGKDHSDFGDVRIRTTDVNFNILSFSISYDVANYAYVAGAGRGSTRPLVEVSNARANQGIFSRRETYKSIQTDDVNILQDEGLELISDQGVYSLTGEIIGDLAQRYRYGDRIRIEHENLVIDSEINYVRVDVSNEIYNKSLRIESA